MTEAKEKIYIWAFFDREEYYFHIIAERNQTEADRKAWEYYTECRDAYIQNDYEIEYCSADSVDEFIDNDYNYINLCDIGGLECKYKELYV